MDVLTVSNALERVFLVIVQNCTLLMIHVEFMQMT